jgi:ORF6N domain
LIFLVGFWLAEMVGSGVFFVGARSVTRPGANCDLLEWELSQSEPGFVGRRSYLLDSDLAVLYGIVTANLNKTVKRNLARFPGDFMMQLNDEEDIPNWNIKTLRPWWSPLSAICWLSRVWLCFQAC